MSSLRRILVPLIRAVEARAPAPPTVPGTAEEGTRFPEVPWDLRTVIIVFPPDSPFCYLNLNILTGLTGTAFDQTAKLGGRAAEEVFDLQFCLQAHGAAITYKAYHSLPRELEYRSGEVFFRLAERLAFSGRWPEYEIVYRQNEEDFSLKLAFVSEDELQWWAYVPGLYCHYTSFGLCRGEWEWKGERGSWETSGLHDHGFGRNLLPLRLPLKVFRYEVLRLPPGQHWPTGGQVLALWTEGPLGLELKAGGVLRPADGPNVALPRYEWEAQEWNTYRNYEGRRVRMPVRWKGRLSGPPGEFVFEAVQSSEPQAVLGNGFLYAFKYDGEWNGAGREIMKGEGYVEQLGFVLRG